MPRLTSLYHYMPHCAITCQTVPPLHARLCHHYMPDCATITCQTVPPLHASLCHHYMPDCATITCQTVPPLHTSLCHYMPHCAPLHASLCTITCLTVPPLHASLCTITCLTVSLHVSTIPYLIPDMQNLSQTAGVHFSKAAPPPRAVL